jgi:Alw26I/Eco31I/Esp3I family type II restriction m6 adenine DNA methyltransferase
MVDQSLKQYLLTKTRIDDDRIATMLSYEYSEVSLSESEKVSIISTLDEIKIIDPACGSGAFPMGVLHKMLLVLQKADPNLQLWLKNHLGNIEPGIFKDRLLERIKSENWEYVRKLLIIQKSIYGVDIQTIAVEISKLRFFLSLIVDEKIDDLKNNRGVEALPNLEFKFVAANSLIGLPPVINRQVGLGIVNEEITRLKELRNKYLRSHGREKKQIEEDFLKTRGKLIEQNIKWGGKDALALQLANWNPFSNETSEWFDPGWMFGIEDGFDVVIANPPYDVLNITEGQRISPTLLETIRTMPVYKITLGGKLNFFRLFIAFAFSLMRKTGVLTYIIPYAFMCDRSAKALREFVLTEKQLKFIEAFPERDNPNKRLFEAVKMSTCIVCIRNTREDILFPVRTHYSREISLGVPTVHVNNSIIKSIDPENLSIPLMSDSDLVIVKHVLRNAPTRLSDFGRCYEGEVNLTFHKKFLTSKDSLAPMIKGAAIQRYQILEEMSQGEIQYLNSTAFLKYNTSPKSKHHKFRRIVMQGITGVNEAVRLKMTIINSGIFCGNSANYILIEDSSLQQEYLLALLNSRLMNWYFKLFSTNSNVNGYQVDNLPIARPGTCGTKMVAKVNEILSITKDADYLSNTAKQTKVRELERQIDQMVYEIYRLTPEEIAVVEGYNKK